MTWSGLDTWIVVVAVLSAAACALPGNFLVLRRMSLMGDAISHAVLPGIAIAFLFTGSRGAWPMFIGATVMGILTAAISDFIGRYGKVEASAGLGAVFSILFAIGLIILVRGADAVDLDPNCVLYGAIELTPARSHDAVWSSDTTRRRPSHSAPAVQRRTADAILQGIQSSSLRSGAGNYFGF